MKIDTKALIEALKEAGRVALIAIIPIVIDSIQGGEFSWRTVGVVAGIAFLRSIDKYLHNLEPDGVAGGLTRF